jgi:NitT/TauT family transport system ATP-binding protein
MEGLFPIGPGMSRVRGIVSIVKQNKKGRIEISKLAEESEEDIDDLLPLIEACKVLGFIEVVESEVKLTKKGAKLTPTNFAKLISEGLEEVEPFKSTVKIIDSKQVTSVELFETLRSRGIRLHGEDAMNNALLKKLLIRWGVRSKLISYDQELDLWSRRKG